jgi:hypothetical protein
MPRSFTMLGYGVVAVTGASLFLTGAPARRGTALADQAPAASAPAASPPAVVSVAGVTLTSLSVKLPASDRTFPDGPGADAINNNCLGCHSAAMVINQPPLPRSAWQAEVGKMRSWFKAPLDDGDVPAIVGYLDRIRGNG